MKHSYSIALDEDLISEIDTGRGEVPRSPYVARLLREALDARKAKRAKHEGNT